MRRLIGAQQFWMVHGIDGELLAEYLWNGTTATIQKEYGYRNGDLLVVAEGEGTVTWMVKDHLGTPRMNVARSGAIGKRHDYLPFGEENLAGSVRSVVANGYGVDSIRQKFTGYERDSEAGLDFAQARYYANAQGRFTSPDEPLVGQDAIDPQTWNLYGYTSNNPLNRIDPDGRRWFYREEKGKIVDIRWIDPNEDGSFTSPGEGWLEFIPTRERATLSVTDEDGRAWFLGETSSGDPQARWIWSGAVRDSSWELVALIIPGRIGLRGMTAGLSALLTKYLARTGGAAFLNQLSGTDSQILQRAISQGLSATNTFADNVAKLVQAVRSVIPNGQINKIGEIAGSPIYGSLRSGVGIAQVDGIQVVVKVVQGSTQIIGKLP